MLDFSWGEFLVIGTVALVVIGPKELPGVLRTVGQAVGKVRRMASEFQGQFQEALREAEFEDAKRTISGLTDSTASFNPIQTIRDEIKNVVDRDTSSAPAGADAPVAVPEPPPVPDLTPEQIQAAFAPPPPTAFEDFSAPASEPAPDAKPKRPRRKKAEAEPVATVDETPVAAPAASPVSEDAAVPKKKAPRKRAAKAPAAETGGDEGGGA
jgi:sec-independent protein translocase protein TatB